MGMPELGGNPGFGESASMAASCRVIHTVLLPDI
jgi:hypothetical protein